MNQNPEQLVHENFDAALLWSGLLNQGKSKINLNANLRVVVSEYKTDISLGDHVIFDNKIPVGVIEVNFTKEKENQTSNECQSDEYSNSKSTFFLVVKMNCGEHTEHQTMVTVLCGNNRKFIDLYPVLNQTPNRSI